MDENKYKPQEERAEDKENSTPSHAIEPENSIDEETAAELTGDDHINPADADDEAGIEANNAIGWLALASSIISFFLMPFILGGAGIILGFISRNRGAETLGITSIVAGAVSILIRLFIIPYV
ncbi:MAG TPA: hypothetical protein VK136_01965 [Bacillota bacterium]|nr:hypothetical protein [Bacillota bacterium]